MYSILTFTSHYSIFLHNNKYYSSPVTMANDNTFTTAAASVITGTIISFTLIER